MKVELFAIVKDKANVPALPQQMIHEAFSEIGSHTEGFRVYDNPRAFFGEMAKAFSRSRIIVAAADKQSFLEQKWTLLKALGIKSEICSAIVSQIKAKGNTADPSLKAHALMPKDATVFMSSDGLYSGFAVKSGKQTLCYLPLDESITAEMINNGVRQYFKDETNSAVNAVVKSVVPQKREVPDNDERFVHTATTLAEKELSVAIASTQTSVFIQNGVRNHPHYGDSFIFTEADDINDGDGSVQERMVHLAEISRSEIGTELGAVISNIYSSGTDSDELFIYVVLSDKDRALVRKIVGLPGETANDLVHIATNEMFSLVLSYADGTLVPEDDAEMIPVKLYEDTGMTDEAVAKQKKGVALKITVCVVIALILSLLIGFYFKDEVAAFFVTRETFEEQTEASTVLDEFVFVEVTEEETKEETTTEAAAEADFAELFENTANGLYHETPSPYEEEPEVQTTTPATTVKETTTKAETTTVKETTTKAETTTAVTTTEATTKETTTKETTTKETTTKETTTEKTTEKEVEKAEETTTQKETEKSSETTGDGVFTFTVYGYGHGVGMSQMGAITYGNSEGRFNWKYDKILSHYYTGTTLQKEIPPLMVKRGSSVIGTKEFLIRTVQAEIGGSCKAATMEAIKAQVVAVYTYVKYYNYSVKTSDMAYSTISNLSSYIEKAVEEVYGEYLCYSSGKTAFTPFYASSAGKTSNAQDTWGGKDYPTLTGGIESEETVSISTCKITSDEFKKVVEKYNSTVSDGSKKITLSGSPSDWIEIKDHDGVRGNIGYVKTIRVGDQTMRGNSFRSMIISAYSEGIIKSTMKSHCFSLEVS